MKDTWKIQETNENVVKTSTIVLNSLEYPQKD